MTPAGSYVVNFGPSVEGFLLPAADDEGIGFWEGTLLGELRVQVCTSCGHFRHPPRPMCPRCRSTGREWRPVPGRGTVWSFIVPHPPLLAPYAEIAPYNVIVVALDEHPHIRFVGNLISGEDGELGDIDPTTIEIGDPVRVVFKHFKRDDGSEEALPFWVRVTD